MMTEWVVSTVTFWDCQECAAGCGEPAGGDQAHADLVSGHARQHAQLLGHTVSLQTSTVTELEG